MGRAVYYASLAMVTELRSKEEYHKIQSKYAGLNYNKEPIKAEHRSAELEEARKKYVNALNCILQSIANDAME